MHGQRHFSCEQRREAFVTASHQSIKRTQRNDLQTPFTFKTVPQFVDHLIQLVFVMNMHVPQCKAYLWFPQGHSCRYVPLCELVFYYLQESGKCHPNKQLCGNGFTFCIFFNSINLFIIFICCSTYLWKDPNKFYLLYTYP